MDTDSHRNLAVANRIVASLRVFLPHELPLADVQLALKPDRNIPFGAPTPNRPNYLTPFSL